MRRKTYEIDNTKNIRTVHGKTKPFTPRMFESKEDRQREAKFAEYICEKKKCKMFKLPIHWCLDYLVTNQKQQGIAWAEMKSRKVAHDCFKTFRISALKFVRGVELSERFFTADAHENPNAKMLQFLIFVEWADNKRMYYKHDAKNNERLCLVWGGRTSKENFRVDAANDVEAMVEIPLDMFIEI